MYRRRGVVDGHQRGVAGGRRLQGGGSCQMGAGGLGRRLCAVCRDYPPDVTCRNYLSDAVVCRSHQRGVAGGRHLQGGGSCQMGTDGLGRPPPAVCHNLSVMVWHNYLPGAEACHTRLLGLVAYHIRLPGLAAYQCHLLGDAPGLLCMRRGALPLSRSREAGRGGILLLNGEGIHLGFQSCGHHGAGSMFRGFLGLYRHGCSRWVYLAF